MQTLARIHFRLNGLTAWTDNLRAGSQMMFSSIMGSRAAALTHL
jgi:hypothetical protein